MKTKSKEEMVSDMVEKQHPVDVGEHIYITADSCIELMKGYATQQTRDLQLSHDALVHKLMAIREVVDSYDGGEIIERLNAILNTAKEGGV